MGQDQENSEMALTEYQIVVLKLLAERRKNDGESYIAGGTALNLLLQTPRMSKDIDIFHDTGDALIKAWESDKKILKTNGYKVEIIREYPSFIEAEIHKTEKSVLIQWCRDSAFRFFPLIEHPILGLTLHPFDLATNKILAMSGRLEPRDWIDSIECSRAVQQLGFLIWAAAGKDPGLNPNMLLEDASRLHYSQTEINMLDFEGEIPSVATLSRLWKEEISEGKKIIEELPEEMLGRCVLFNNGTLYNWSSLDEIKEDLSQKRIVFHEGKIGGAWPEIKTLSK
jgi:hypothetical protein